jgi:hypothetical protein
MFKQALKHWGNDDFFQYFKLAFNKLTLDELPLFDYCTHSLIIDKDSIDITMLSSADNEQVVILKIGVFFREVLSGCACNDDPSQAIIFENSYCELSLEINQQTAKISFN